jgi:two-component system NtrC family sensor kinase
MRAALPSRRATPSLLPAFRLPEREVPALAWAMLACLSAVGILAFLDAERESSNALFEFAQEQARLAQSVGLHVSSRLAQGRRDLLILEEASVSGAPVPSTLAETFRGEEARNRVVPISFVTEGLSALELPMQLLVLVRPPGAPLRTTDGRPAPAPTIEAALDGREAYVRLDRAAAGRLGLPPRTAMVGLARIDGGPQGHWDVAVVASAERLRDRERWARWRLLLTVTAAGGLVFLFGGIGLRNQRRELVAEHALALAKIENTQEDRLQRAARAATLGTLAIGVAHEISTPLGVISGRAEQLLERVRGDERGERAAQTVLEQTEGIGRVIKGLLHLARGGTPEFVPVDVDAIVREAVSMSSHKFVAAGIKVEMAPSGDEPFVLGDTPLLEHAVINLLLNACDASPRGRTVMVAVAATEDSVRIYVADQGPGISDEHARLAMEPFFTTKSEGQGTGLGLAIAHEIVSSHRGTLTLARQEPHGTLALITLPAGGQPHG